MDHLLALDAFFRPEFRVVRFHFMIGDIGFVTYIYIYIAGSSTWTLIFDRLMVLMRMDRPNSSGVALLLK